MTFKTVNFMRLNWRICGNLTVPYVYMTKTFLIEHKTKYCKTLLFGEVKECEWMARENI